MTEDDPHAYWAWMYLTLGAFECAGRYLETAPADCPYRPGISLRRVMSLGQLKETTEALATARRAYEGSPGSSMTRMAMLLAHGYIADGPNILKWADDVLSLGIPRREWNDPFPPEQYASFPEQMKAIMRGEPVGR